MTRGRPRQGTEGVEPLLNDGGFHAAAIRDVIAGTRESETVTEQSWLRMLLETDGLGIRFDTRSRTPYYLTWQTRDGQCSVWYRGSATTHDPEGPYIESLFDEYDAQPVVVSEVDSIDD